MLKNKIDLISKESIESYGDLYLIFASILCNDKIYYNIKNMEEDVYEQLMILLNSIIVFQPKFVCGLIGFDMVMRTHWIRHRSFRKWIVRTHWIRHRSFRKWMVMRIHWIRHRSFRKWIEGIK